ncbi:MAG: hypothetical protein WBI57_13485 [Desulfobacterales bacterium]
MAQPLFFNGFTLDARGDTGVLHSMGRTTEFPIQLQKGQKRIGDARPHNNCKDALSS